MSSSFMTAGAWWVELALVMAAGAGLVVGLAAGASRWARSGRGQQALWRVGLSGVWGLLLVELVGIGPALGVWVRAMLGPGQSLPSTPPLQTRLVAQPVSTHPGRDSAQDSDLTHAASQTKGTALPEAILHHPAQGAPAAEPTTRLSDANRQHRREAFPAGQPAAQAAQQIASSARVVPQGDRQPARPAPAALAEVPGSVGAEAGHLVHPGQLEHRDSSCTAQTEPLAGPGDVPSAFGTESQRHVEPPTPGAQPPLQRIADGVLHLYVAAEPYGAWLARIWAIGSALLLGWTAWSRWLLGRLRTALSPVHWPELEERAGRLARQLGLRRPVAILESPKVATPVAFGVFRPVLVVPAGFGAEFSQSQQEAMLAHELAHLARRDPLWLLWCDALCAVLWWHPAVWFLRHRLRVASEWAADEGSLLVPGGPELLAGCLVGLARRTVRAQVLGWLSVEGGGFRSALGRRVERLLGLRTGQVRPGRRSIRAAMLAGLAVLLVVVPVLSTSWVRAQAGLWQGETTMSVLRMSWQRWLAALAAAAFLGPAPAPAVAAEHPDAPRAVAPKKEDPHAPRLKDAPREGEHRRAEREGRPEEPPPHLRELMERHRHLEEQARELSAALERARPDSDDARELRGKLERIKREMEEIAQQLRRGPGRGEGERPAARPRGELPPVPPELIAVSWSNPPAILQSAWSVPGPIATMPANSARPSSGSSENSRRWPATSRRVGSAAKAGCTPS